MTVYTHLRDLPPIRRRLAKALRIYSIEHGDRSRSVQIRSHAFELTLRARYLSDLHVGAKLIDWGTDRDSNHRWSLALKVPGASFYLKLPNWLLPSTPGVETHRSYGVDLTSTDTEFPDQLYCEWGRRHKFIELPWHLVNHRHSYLLATGNWYHDIADERPGTIRARRERWNRLRAWVGLSPLPLPDRTHHYELTRSLNKYKERHPYCYVLRSGEAQDVVADITVEEWETRRHITKWFPWAGRVRRCINISFSSEIGEETGSYKGGCVGTSYTMLPGELPVHALKRMEAERRF